MSNTLQIRNDTYKAWEALYATNPSGFFSCSKRGTYQKCPHLYSLHYERGIKKVPRSMRLEQGVAVHAGLEYALLTGEGWTERGMHKAVHDHVHSVAGYAETHGVPIVDKEGVALDPDKLEELIEHCYELAFDAATDLDLTKWEVLYLTASDGELIPCVELRLFDHLPGWEGMIGIVDAVLRDKATGYLWLVDFKTRDSFHSMEQDEHAIQFLVYMYMLRRYGVDCVGTIQYQIRNKIPSVPNVNKNGTLSRAKTIFSTWEVYSQTARDLGLDPNDYLDMKEYLENNCERFRMIRSYRTNTEIETAWQITKDVAYSILNDVCMPRNMSTAAMGCVGCSHREICLAEMQGLPTDYLFETGLYASKV